jgi:antitoxin (DNA-binding transcriptional repressor) of toxin-antitoxin stability system
MAITASDLRRDVYKLLDRVLATGEPVEIERGGRKLYVVADSAPTRLERIKGNPDLIRGDPDELVHLNWSGHWDPDGAQDP